MIKQNLIGKTRSEMQEIVRSLKQQKYRADQLFNWIYKKRVTSFNEMTNFSKEFRYQLDNQFQIGQLKMIKISRAPSLFFENYKENKGSLSWPVFGNDSIDLWSVNLSADYFKL